MKPRSRYRGLTLFVTVGTTRFDKLIETIIQRDCIEQIVELGFTKLVIQIGDSKCDLDAIERLNQEFGTKLNIEFYKLKGSIKEDIERADVVVGHAGAGTCLEVLRSQKRLLIVVNESLMNNHQSELADQLCEDKFVMQTNVNNFNEDLKLICNSETKLNKFPPVDSTKFEQIFNDALNRVNAKLHSST